jgi:hypothetical protein
LKKYQNELLVLLALLLMLGAYVYKNNQTTAGADQAVSMKASIGEIKEITGLKRVWVDKKISKKVDQLEKLLDASKVKWSKKGKKLTANYSNLTPKELNQLTTKILNLAVQIDLLKIEKKQTAYDVEFKCKW